MFKTVLLIAGHVCAQLTYQVIAIRGEIATDGKSDKAGWEKIKPIEAIRSSPSHYI